MLHSNEPSFVSSVQDISAVTKMSERHVRRVIQSATGMTPHALRQVRRLATAQTLLMQTSLPIIDVAFSADFSSLRQFNYAFKRAFAITPRQMRANRTEGQEVAPAILHVKLTYKLPMEWRPLVNGLLAHATPNLDEHDSRTHTLTRYVLESGVIAKATIDLRDYGTYVKLKIETPNTRIVDAVVERIRRLLDLDHDSKVSNALLRQDPVLEPLIAARPGLRIVGAWDPYELMVLTIIGQQISVRAARTMAGRLVAQYGQPNGNLHLFPGAEVLASATAIEINRLTGINIRKVAAIKEFARLVADGLDLDDKTRREETLERLLTIPGIGPWSIAYVALRGFGDPDAFPADDLLVKRKLGAVNGRQALLASGAWRPFRAYATMHIWTEGAYV